MMVGGRGSQRRRVGWWEGADASSAEGSFGASAPSTCTDGEPPRRRRRSLTGHGRDGRAGGCKRRATSGAMGVGSGGVTGARWPAGAGEPTRAEEGMGVGRPSEERSCAVVVRLWRMLRDDRPECEAPEIVLEAALLLRLDQRLRRRSGRERRAPAARSCRRRSSLAVRHEPGAAGPARCEPDALPALALGPGGLALEQERDVCGLGRLRLGAVRGRVLAHVRLERERIDELAGGEGEPGSASTRGAMGEA